MGVLRNWLNAKRQSPARRDRPASIVISGSKTATINKKGEKKYGQCPAKNSRYQTYPAVMQFGYARVSTTEQNTAVQIAAFKRAGIDQIVQEKRSAIKDRPELVKLLKRLQPGDTLVVYKLDRLARSVSHFVRVFEDLKSRGIGFKSLTESIETESPQGRMFLHLLSAFAEFERDLIRERCLAGQRAARAAGKTWGKKKALTDREAQQVTDLWRTGWGEQKVLAEMLGITAGCLRDHIHRVEGRGRWAKGKLQP